MVGPKAGGVQLQDYWMRLNVMSTYKVRWTPYLLQEINDVQFSMYHNLLSFFDIVEPYMLERFLRQFEWQQDIPISSVIRPITTCRLAMGKIYFVWRTFVVAYWEQAINRCVDVDIMRIISMPPSTCTSHYMVWYRRHTL